MEENWVKKDIIFMVVWFFLFVPIIALQKWIFGVLGIVFVSVDPNIFWICVSGLDGFCISLFIKRAVKI